MFYVSRQVVWPDGNRVVEVVSPGMDHAGPDMLVDHFKSLGEGKEFADPREALEAALAVRDAWQAKSTAEDEDTVQVNFMGHDEETDEELHAIAETMFEKMPKCDNCGDPLGRERDQYKNRETGEKYCSENCAQAAADFEEEQQREMDRENEAGDEDATEASLSLTAESTYEKNKQLADEISQEWYGKNFRDLPDDGEEQDHIMNMLGKRLQSQDKKAMAARLVRMAKQLMADQHACARCGDTTSELSKPTAYDDWLCAKCEAKAKHDAEESVSLRVNYQIPTLVKTKSGWKATGFELSRKVLYNRISSADFDAPPFNGNVQKLVEVLGNKWEEKLKEDAHGWKVEFKGADIMRHPAGERPDINDPRWT